MGALNKVTGCQYTTDRIQTHNHAFLNGSYIVGGSFFRLIITTYTLHVCGWPAPSQCLCVGVLSV